MLAIKRCALPSSSWQRHWRRTALSVCALALRSLRCLQGLCCCFAFQFFATRFAAPMELKELLKDSFTASCSRKVSRLSTAQKMGVGRRGSPPSPPWSTVVWPLSQSQRAYGLPRRFGAQTRVLRWLSAPVASASTPSLPHGAYHRAYHRREPLLWSNQGQKSLRAASVWHSASPRRPGRCPKQTSASGPRSRRRFCQHSLAC